MNNDQEFKLLLTSVKLSKKKKKKIITYVQDFYMS